MSNLVEVRATGTRGNTVLVVKYLDADGRTRVKVHPLKGVKGAGREEEIADLFDSVLVVRK